MSRVCPNKNAPEWKALVSKLGDEGAMRAFMMYEDQPDALKIAADKLDISKFTIEDKIDRLTSTARKVEFDRTSDPVTGDPGHNYFMADSSSPGGRKRLQSVSEILDLDENTKYRGDEAGNAFSKKGDVVHDAFNKIARGYSSDTVISTLKNGGFDANLYPQLKAIYDELSSRGHVMSEIGLSNLKDAAGTGDIVLLANDGTVEYYDIKTAHKTPRFRLHPKEKVWDPANHFAGYKARRYPTQVKFYEKFIENTLGQPVSKSFIIPIEVSYKNYDPNQGIEEVKILDLDDVSKYGYDRKAQRIVDTFFGEYKAEPRPALLSPDDSSQFLTEISGRIEDRVTDLEQEAENILGRTVRKGGLLYYRSNTGLTLLKSQSDKALQRRQIIDEFLSRKESAKRDIVESIKNHLQGHTDVFMSGTGKVQENLRLLLSKYQGSGRDIQVYELSDIEGFHNKQGWIVIQEGQDHDLLYMGNDKLESKLSLNKKQDTIRTLFRNFYTGAESRFLLKSDLKDTVLDAKKFEATMIALKMKESNKKASFGRMMIYSLNEISGDLPRPVNLSTVLPITKNVLRGGRIPVPASYQSIANNDYFFDHKNYNQDFTSAYTDYLTAVNKTADSIVYRAIGQYQKGDIATDKLLSMISSEISYLRSTEKPNEYNQQLYLLSNLYYQLRDVDTKPTIISTFERWISMPSNIASPIIQDLYSQVKNAANRIREAFWNGYKKSFLNVQKALFKESGFLDTIQDYTISNTSKYYEPLMVKVMKKVRGEDGQVSDIETNVFEFLDEDSEAFNRLSDPQKNYITKANDTIQEAAEIAGIEWKRGRLPLIQGSFMNRFYKAMAGTTTLSSQDAYKESLGKLFESVEDNFGLGGSRKGSDNDNYLRNFFDSQANSEEYEGKRPEMLGFTEDGFVEPEQHSQYETNLEVVLDLFMMNSIRVREFNNVSRTFKAAKTLFEMQKSGLLEDQLQTNIDWVQTWEIAMLNGRDVDSGSLANKSVRTVNKVASAFLIGFKPATALLSYMGQELTATSQAVANSLARNDSFKASHWLRAGAMVFRPGNSEKINLLLEQYGMFDLDLNSLVNGRRRYGNRSIFKSKFLYGLMNSGDWGTRAQVLVAQMLNDGTWDSYNVENGELVYDESKDTRFQKTDGHLIREAIKEQLSKEGHLTGKQDDPMSIRRMTRAYDDRLANKLKFEADSIVGGFDRETRGLYSFNALGKLLGLFKTWLPSRLNRGFDREFDSMVNGNYVIETDATGTKQVVWRGKQMEGIMHSVLAGLYWLRNIKNKQSQVPLTQGQKDNLYRLMSDVIFMGSAMLVAMGLPDDDKETKLDDNSADMLRKSVSDIFSVYNGFQALELLYTPVAVEFTEKSLTQIWKILSGAPNPEIDTTTQLLKLGPVTRHFTWLLDELEE